MTPEREWLVLNTLGDHERKDMTASIGFDKPLYILSFDYRNPLLTTHGLESMLTGDHAAEVASTVSEIVTAKRFVYDGFKAALAAGLPRDKAGILVDEHLGAAILTDAVAQGYVTACPAEKSGDGEFDFKYGEDFAKHIEAFHPTFCKVQIRYNPEGNPDLNRRQSVRLKRLSDYLHGESRSLFLLELLLPPEKEQLKELKGDKDAYHMEVRPRLKVEAIQQLQGAQVEPDVWGIEGLDRREDCEKVVAAARRGGRDKVGCIILPDTGKPEQTIEWLTTAAGVPGFIGFAAGPTIFWDPISRWLARKTAPKAAVLEIGQRFREFVNVFEGDRYQKVS
jgi:myo-inositol catabolism protein IolC